MTRPLDDLVARPQQTARFSRQMLCTVSEDSTHGIVHEKRGDT